MINSTRKLKFKNISPLTLKYKKERLIILELTTNISQLGFNSSMKNTTQDMDFLSISGTKLQEKQTQ